MRILTLETSGTRGGIALLEADGLQFGGGPYDGAAARAVDEVRLAEGLRHGRDLVLAAKEACERARWNPRKIELVAVSIGPGSFTGIRIAVVVAKFMAMDTGAKIAAVPSFRALAENAPADRRRIVVIGDAKRGGLFASLFDRRSGAAEGPLGSHFDEVFGPALIEPEALAARLESSCAFIVGSGIVKAGAAMAAFDLASEDLWDIRPSIVGRLGAEMAARGELTDPLRLEPVYIRPPEAQEVWERKERMR